MSTQSSAKPVSVLLVGAGIRGSGYVQLARKLETPVQVVGVAEPRAYHREKIVREHGVLPDNTFNDWKVAASKPRIADVVIITTQDNMHTEPAIAFAQKGYHILLEKPMAPTVDACMQIVAAAKKSGSFFAVCHVLRYTPFTTTLKNVLLSGVIGELVSLQHLEPVGYWHQAHSFVRGNWRREDQSSSMLLAKSCHDLDWIRYIMDAPCEKISSFGSLRHFTKSNRPAGAADRCLDCEVESQCPYSGKKIYLEAFKNGLTEWPVNVLTDDLSVEGITKALREGPYGRCVYDCDNDVVDNQVVNMSFAGGRTAAFTMTAFTHLGHRITRLFGTRGEISTDGESIEVYDFLTDQRTQVPIETSGAGIEGGHGGGDDGLIKSFFEAVSTGDARKILSGPDETLQSHLMVFAAEESRKTSRTVNLSFVT